MTAPTKNVVDLATASTLAGTDKVLMVDVSDTTEGPLGTVKIAAITSLSAFFDVISAQGLTTVTNNSGVFVNSSGGVTSGGAVNYDSGGDFLSSVKIGGSAAANALDDYEEGTWTPTLTLTTPGDSSSATPVGIYTKIGNTVFIQGRITFTKGTGSGDLVFGSLPFAANSTSGYQATAAISTDEFGAAGKIYNMFLQNSQTVPSLFSIAQAGGAGAAASASDFGASAISIRFSLTYHV